MTPVPLPPRPTGASASTAIRRFLDREDQLERFLDAQTWPVRMASMEPWFAAHVTGSTNTGHVALILTAFLEQLGERSIGTLDQALMYRFSLNPEWQAAAMQFLDGMDDPLALASTYPAFTLFGLDRYGQEVLNTRD